MQDRRNVHIVRTAGRWTPPAFAFPLAALSIVALCLTVARSALFAESPGIGALGVTFDLAVTIPFLYWLCVVRPGRAPAITLVPVVLVGLFATRMVVPAEHREILAPLPLLALPLELLAAGAIVVRARRALVRVRGLASPPSGWLERLEVGAREAFGESRAIDVLVSELAFVRYAVLGWGRAAEAPPGATAFSYHRERGWGAVLAALLLLLAAEGTVAHLLLAQWSPVVAWIWTGLDLYAVLWLLGDMNGLRLRPVLLWPDRLEVRFGLRWRATIPLDRIARVERLAADPEDWKRKGSLKLALLDPPDLKITFAEPVVFHGPVGLRRRVSRLGLLVDDSVELERRLTELSPATRSCPTS